MDTNTELIQNLLNIIENQQAKINSLSNELQSMSNAISNNGSHIRDLFEYSDTLNNYTKFIDNKLINLLKSYNHLHQLHSCPHIVKPKIDYDMKMTLKNDFCGINKDCTRDKKVIVSFTSFPDRMYDIKYTLFSLLTQSFKPDMVILWLAEEQFPNKEKDISDEILAFKEYGLSIKWCEDLKSYKKIIPSLREYPDDIIIPADDDMYYYSDWLKDLYNAYTNSPQCINTFSTNSIIFENNKIADFKFKDEGINTPTFNLIVCGGYGNVYPPHCLHHDIFNIDLIKEIAPYEDDLWIWAMAVLNDTKLKTVPAMDSYFSFNKIKHVSPERQFLFNDEHTIFRLNSFSSVLKDTFFKILEYFPEIENKILSAENMQK